MQKTYNGRRVYGADDFMLAADILRDALDKPNDGKGYSEKEIKAAVRMMQDIANGMCHDDGIICDGNVTELEHGVYGV